jgi:methylenetetrahydrofolate dehydrogenase (NADP+)/methenyltetrahydrofolate cyclohydrolase
MDIKMREKLLMGTEFARQKLDFIGEELQFMRERFGFQLTLAVLSIDSCPTNQLYLKNLQKAAAYCGVEIREFNLFYNITEKQVMKKIKILSNNREIDGILIQEPVLSYLNSKKLAAVLDPQKDVDCIHPVNRKKALAGERGAYPVVVAGILDIIKYKMIPLAGTEVIVAHRNKDVAEIIAKVLTKQKAKVRNLLPGGNKLQNLLKEGELIISGMAQPRFIDKRMIKNDVIVLDVGFNVINNMLAGDVNLEEIISKVKAVTPVPGGIGPLAVAAVMETSFLGFSS